MVLLCVDFGSTFTKVACIDRQSGELVASVSRPTTLDTDIMDGLAACQDSLRRQGIRTSDAEIRACSSAGGGLRVAIIGHEELVTSEAGRRVALSSGGRVVATISGGLSADKLPLLDESRPDLILLVGGTDGGNASVLLASARTLAESAHRVPIVVAGNAEAAAEIDQILAEVDHVIAPNVVPEIGVFAPDGARARVREMFLSHVIGGKQLSKSSEFAEMVVGATPDVVLRGTEFLAAGTSSTEGSDVVVIDVGGATTDVHSVVRIAGPDAERDAGLSREVVAPAPAARTVEGDLGMRWSAIPTADLGASDGLIDGIDQALVTSWARSVTPGQLPSTGTERTADALLARTAIAAAIRRHAGRSEAVWIAGRRVLRHTGIDIREAELVIGSGGVLRADPTAGADLLRAGLERAAGTGRMLPELARIVIDRDYVLAAIGLLSDWEPRVASGLAAKLRLP